MIIHKIRAENVLKYAELAIDLAEKGLVAISGQNESGKSSIGETVCFALFGRTFSMSPGEVDKVVRWGENHCSVTLEFSVQDQHYILSRYLDLDGNHSAKLALAEDQERPIARGVKAVGEALFEVLGFDYDEFVESFYLAQREITTPHPHSQAVKIMAGVAPLEKVAKAFESEIEERQELIEEIRAERDAVDHDAQAIGLQEGRLQLLEDERQRSHEQLEQVRHLSSDISSGLETCINNTGLIRQARGAKGRTGFLRFIAFLLALAAAGLWALLSYGGHLPQAETARDLLTQYLPQWREEWLPLIAYLAVGLGVLFVVLWVRSSGLKQRILTLQEESRQLGGTLNKARLLEIDRPVEDAPVEAEAAAEDETPESASDDSEPEPAVTRPTQEEYETLRSQIDFGEVSERLAGEYCGREVAWLDDVAQRFASEVEVLDVEIEIEQSRVQEAIDLGEVLNGLKEKREGVEQRIAERRRGLELLGGAIVHLSNVFNRDVKGLVGRMLPLFTDGRYEHLQIDHDLKVRVFSSEKRNFMDLEEVSSGTQRQIMLALRLALSKKLLRRTVKGKQFAFLDEPFAFFDKERTCKALLALENLGDDISQVWIVAQDFPDDCGVTFDTKIDCERGTDTLNVIG